jgi:pilus assembly protein CpaE
METFGELDNIEVLVIEGDQATGQQIMSLLATSGTFQQRILAPDRPLMAAPGWTGPGMVLVGLDDDRLQRLAYARKVQSAYPSAGIIGYTGTYTADVLGEAMNGGARRVLRFPFDLATLRQAVRDVREELRSIVGQAPVAHGAGSHAPAMVVPEHGVLQSALNRVITVFSPKGGVGCSTLAVNLAVALQAMGHASVLMDGNISFGSADVFLNLQHTRSILQLVGEVQQITREAVLDTLVEHSTGLKVLLAPSRPEEGDSIRGDHLQRVLGLLKQEFRFTIVDTWPSFDERVLAMLETADQILVPIGPELPAMKNLKQFLRVAQLLNYQMEKITLVLMRANSVPPGHLRDIERFLDQELRWRVISDGKRTTSAANTGMPFVLSSRDAEISQNVFDLARFVAGETDTPRGAQRNPPGLVGGLLRRR